jgi:hypothetical protein
MRRMRQLTSVLIGGTSPAIRTSSPAVWSPPCRPRWGIRPPFFSNSWPIQWL